MESSYAYVLLGANAQKTAQNHRRPTDNHLNLTNHLLNLFKSIISAAATLPPAILSETARTRTTRTTKSQRVCNNCAHLVVLSFLLHLWIIVTTQLSSSLLTTNFNGPHIISRGLSASTYYFARFACFLFVGSFFSVCRCTIQYFVEFLVLCFVFSQTVKL